jgi:N-methylhydantoinase B/oxoprolinase/acetone carboxylase alpha subunit
MSSMIACNNVARERMLALIEKYGAATLDEACRTLVSLSETQLRSRLRELPDGQWRSRQYMNVGDDVSRVVLTMTKQGETLHFDFSGSSPQSPHAINCTKWASLGGLFAPLFPLLCYDITWNEGIIRPIEMTAPEGTIVNCIRPAPVSVATVGAIQSVNNAACTTIGKMLAASEKYRHEATAVWHANHFAIFKFGRNQHGRDAIGILTETFAGAGGARTYGGGCGDPLTRPPTAVLRDVQNRIVSRVAAADVYGVVLNDRGDGVDSAATRHRREQAVRSRTKGSHAANDGNGVVVSLRFHHGDAGTRVLCAHCNHQLAAPGEAWKAALEPVARPMREVMAAYTLGGEVKLHEYCCPNCAALLDCETVLEGDPPLLDYIGAVSAAS